MRHRHDERHETDAAQQYRREAARLRALAHASYSAEVRHDLADIAEEYEELAQQRDAIARRYGGE